MQTFFYESDTGKDMSEYFILRRGKNEITGDKLGDKLTLTYMTEDGQTLPVAPSKAGTYKVKADFAGDTTYEACSMEATYQIELPDRITLSVDSKVYDGKPAELNYKVDYDQEYEVKAHTRERFLMQQKLHTIMTVMKRQSNRGVTV